ncbi:hypothetical protein LguiA_004820 [Lonicera macranthoides]
MTIKLNGYFFSRVIHTMKEMENLTLSDFEKKIEVEREMYGTSGVVHRLSGEISFPFILKNIARIISRRSFLEFCEVLL